MREDTMKCQEAIKEARKRFPKDKGYVSAEVEFQEFRRGKGMEIECHIWIALIEESFDGQSFNECLDNIDIYLRKQKRKFKKQADQSDGSKKGKKK